MDFERIYEAIREMVHDYVLETPNARAIMRKAGFRSLFGVEQAAPILSLVGARRQCLNLTTGKVFAGYPAQFAVDDTGQIYGWGAALSGNVFSLPLNALVDAMASPMALDPAIRDVTQIATNAEASLLLRSDGSVWTSAPPNPALPDANTWEASGMTGAIQVGAIFDIPSGPQYILKSDGTIWGKGRWMAGMGVDPTPFGPAFAWSTNINEFQQMPSAKIGTGVEEIAVSLRRLSWRLSDGTVKTWGNNQEFPVTPTGVPLGVAKVVGGQDFIAILSDAGQIYTSGGDSSGQAGNGVIAGDNAYAAWRLANGTDYTDVGAVRFATLAVKGGRLWTWGAGGARSARGTAAANSSVPVEITNPDISDVTGVHGHAFTQGPMYTTESGCVYIWGVNEVADLGLGYFGSPNIGIPTPLLVSEGYTIQTGP